MILKWTDYYGDVRRVELFQNEYGLFGGYCNYDGPKCGVTFDPIKKLPKDQYWDTELAAIKGTLKNLKKHLKDSELFRNWMMNTLADMKIRGRFGTEEGMAVKVGLEKYIHTMDHNSIYAVKGRIEYFKKRLSEVKG